MTIVNREPHGAQDAKLPLHQTQAWKEAMDAAGLSLDPGPPLVFEQASEIVKRLRGQQDD